MLAGGFPGRLGGFAGAELFIDGGRLLSFFSLRGLLCTLRGLFCTLPGLFCALAGVFGMLPAGRLVCTFRSVPGCAAGAILMFVLGCRVSSTCARRICETPTGLPPLA